LGVYISLSTDIDIGRCIYILRAIDSKLGVRLIYLHYIIYIYIHIYIYPT